MKLFSVEHPDHFEDWYNISQHVALLSIEDEESLLKLADKLRKKGCLVSIFREPDMDNQATSFAVEATETAQRFTTSLRLAFSEYYEQWAQSQGIESDPVSNYFIKKLERGMET